MLVKENIKDIYTLSPLQEGMFFHSLYDSTAITYFEQQCFRQTGKLSIDNVEKSLNELFKRYDILRTVFVYKNEKPLQIVLKERNVEFYYEDIIQRTNVSEYLDVYKEKDRVRFFDLGKDVLMRVAVFQLAKEEFELVWSWHHILMDAWCVGILKNEFFEIYNSLQEGRAVDLPKVHPYKNYIKWLEQRDKKEAKTFWENYLKGYNEVSCIPQNKLPHNKHYEKKEVAITIEDDVTTFLNLLAQEHKVTLGTIMQMIWGILLSKYNNRKDVVFGTIVSGRPVDIDGIEAMVGLFINTLPIRVKYDAATSFIELLKSFKKEVLQADEFSYYSLADIQAGSEIKQNLINHILLFQNFMTSESEAGMLDANVDGNQKKEIETLKVESFEQYYYDLNFFVLPGRQMNIVIKYNNNVYSNEVISNVLKHFKIILNQIKSNIEILVADVTLLSAKEKSDFLKDNKVYLSSDSKSFLQLFEEQVKKTPHKEAILIDEVRVTYLELNNHANRLAHYLINEIKVQSNEPVGIMLDRSERMIIALLGILKSGAAFLPIDPSTPIDRTEFITQDANVKLLLTDFHLMLRVQDVNVKFLALDVEFYSFKEDLSNPPLISKNSDLAYVIYTSGSTGKPKGVKITIDNFFNYLIWANKLYFDNSPGKNFPLFTSLSFDLTLTSIFTTLLRGDKIFICKNNDVQGNLRYIFDSNYEVTAVKLTPAHINILGLLDLKTTNVDYVIVGGEALTNEQVRILRSLNPNIKIFNEYGPTEATIGCTVKEIWNQDEFVTIGRPIDNTKIFILNDDLNIQPQGITGEIFISGRGVAQGYINRQELTKASFIENPYIQGNTLYKTGDLGRWLSNGELEFLGRKDNQVKVRGYRVEIGEIEHAILTFNSIKEALVVYKEVEGDGCLIGYFTSNEKVDIDHLRSYLEKFLPEYMIPNYLVSMEIFPLTINGKLDKGSFPEVNLQTMSNDDSFQQPRNHTEEKLLTIWKEVLVRQNIGTQEKFFDLGGHSLKAIQIITRVYKEFNVRLELRDVFESQTIEKISQVILKSKETAYLEIPQIEEQEYYTISHSQRRLLVSDQFREGDDAYNIFKGYIFEGDVNLAALQRSFQVLLERHESLRTRFIKINWEFKQIVVPTSEVEFKISYADLSQESEREISELIELEGKAPFNLEKDSPLRCKLIKLDLEKYLFIFTIHHIVSDKRSHELLISEVLQHYKAFNEETLFAPGPLKIQSKDYASWQNKVFSNKEINKDKKFWLSLFSGEIPTLNFPTDYTRATPRTFKGATENITMSDTLNGKLLEISKKFDTSPFVVLLACLKSLISRYTNQQDIIIGTVVSGREHHDLESQIGFYMNTIPLRTSFDKNSTFKNILYKVKESTVEALEHQLYPFDLLINDLNIPRNSDRAPLFDIIISYQTMEGSKEGVEMKNINVSQYAVEKKSTICDLIVDFVQGTDNLFLSLTYNVDLFKPSTIQKLGQNFNVFLTNIVDDINIKIEDILFYDDDMKELQEVDLADAFQLSF